MSCLASRKRPHPPDKSAAEKSSSGSNVKVVVRIRPQNEKETEGNFRVVVQAVDENILVFDPKENTGMEYAIKGRRDIRKRQNRDLKFAFDRVFGPEAQNKEIYEETTNSVLSGLLNGYNCSVFAYGATGAGKTYTMLGTKDKPGVMYHTMMDLYSRIESIKDSATCDVAVSYLEVYNETIRDLLLPGNPLPIREDPGKGVVIPGLSLHKPKNAEELLYMLQFGNQHRSQHPTDANAESSRSHAVFQVFVRQQDRTANISTEVRVAKMCLVDLAGSERATVTKNQGSRFREGANINRSLLALGNVINALAENKTKGFVPYRDSKLTRLLKDSLGGNCQTVMIAAVSPSAMSFEDTYNTLRYADRAKNIKATLKKNVLNVDYHMAKYGQIVTELRKEISELKNKLKSYEEGLNAPIVVQAGPDMSTFIGFQREIDNFFMHHLAMRSDQLQQEIAVKNLEWKLYRKKRSIARVKAINDTEAQSRLETIVKGMNQKSSCLSVSAEISRGKLEENLSGFYDISQRMTDLGGGDTVSEVLSLSLQAHRSKLELQDTKQHLSFTKQVIRCQERELNHNERLIAQLLKLLKNQHYIMKGHNIMTSDLEEEFKDIVKKVGGHELTWEDQVEDKSLQRSSTLLEMLDLPSLKLSLSTAENICKKPSTKGSTTDDTASKKQFWSNQQTDMKPLPYIQVDECSPPKAKRIMLTCPSAQQPEKNETARHRQKHRHTKHSLPHHSNGARQGRFRSYSESSLKRILIDGSSKGMKTISNTVKPQRVVQTNIDRDDINSDCDVQINARFSKINDTITKAKKFSHLHTKSANKNKEQCRTTEATNSENLDSTFTVESDSVVPSVLPSISRNDFSLCDTCSKRKILNPLEKHTVNSEIPCLKCDLHKKQKTDPVSNSQHESGLTVLNNTFDCDKLESGTQNDSNASTLVNQSGSSQTSLASTSTLVENLSQNLSSADENDSVRENSHLLSQALENSSVFNNEVEKIEVVGKDHVTYENSEENEISKQEKIFIGKHLHGSETVTKSKQSLDEDGITDKEIGCSRNMIDGKNSKAARSIKFGNFNNRDSLEKEKAGSSKLNIKTPDRKPLQKVGDSNTPQTGSDSSSLGSMPSSTDSDLSFDKSLNKQKMSATRLFGKENCKLISKLGLPLLSEGSLIVNNNNKSKSKKLQQSPTPGYMQSTKAHTHRIRQNKSFNSDNDKMDVKPGRVKSSITNQRPLLSSMRSKSMSNLSSRTGWQF